MERSEEMEFVWEDAGKLGIALEDSQAGPRLQTVRTHAMAMGMPSLA
eukprot:COSAG02_NODE_11489_length_1714_cov_2.959752_1_plen_47_part_00